MKKVIIIWILMIFFSCNNKSENSYEKKLNNQSDTVNFIPFGYNNCFDFKKDFKNIELKRIFDSKYYADTKHQTYIINSDTLDFVNDFSKELNRSIFLNSKELKNYRTIDTIFKNLNVSYTNLVLDYENPDTFYIKDDSLLLVYLSPVVYSGKAATKIKFIQIINLKSRTSYEFFINTYLCNESNISKF